ncbi:hypothetical protein TL16_g10049 [Triparma laevis f. inornata]|uniref:Tyrosine-protein kinase ephrin type A/B receptor-like domain-containing protein n=1 Tax=Triparma laevis f. inornata TaxID=1714386 RepID=A0A9W7EL54_9STRA|nr:hypothetical protein TL16_g10049 [Triparma laevis f. inornata]
MYSSSIYPIATAIINNEMWCYCPQDSSGYYIERAYGLNVEDGGNGLDECKYSCPGGGDKVCSESSTPGNEIYSMFLLDDFSFNKQQTSENIYPGTECLECSSIEMGYYADGGGGGISGFPSSVQDWINSNRGGGERRYSRVKSEDGSRCHTCPPGYQDSNTGSCTACVVGKQKPSYSNIWNDIWNCHVCTYQYYQDETGQANCKNCPGGYTYSGGPIDGNVDCSHGTIAPAGTYVEQGQNGVSPCPAGRYSSSGATVCTVCPAGKTTADTGSTSIDSCTNCAAGKYVSRGGSSGYLAENDSYICANCPRGTYSTSPGSPSCTQCASGKASDLQERTLESECVNCDPGEYSQQSGAYLGYTVDGYAFVAQTCSSCYSGKYQPAAGQAECLSCPTGTSSVSHAASLSDCFNCAKGKYESNNNCQSCPYGTYNNQTGISERCPMCPDGTTTQSYTYDVVSGSASRSQFDGAHHITNCTACWKGYGGTVNKYSSGMDTKLCDACTQGEYQSNNGTMGCINCPSGKYTEEGASSSTQCLPCPAGKRCCWNYGSYEGVTNPGDWTITDSCTSANTDVTTGNDETVAISSNMVDCEKGFYGGAGENCNNKCMPTTYSTTTGATSIDVCLPCEPGYYCPGFSATAGSNEIYNERKDCPIGSYCPANSASPIRCPAGTSTNKQENVPSRTGCKSCRLGTHLSLLNPAITDCQKCEAGSYAPVVGRSDCLMCAKEFGCAEGGANCSLGYGGNLCGTCQDGYYESGGKCEKCATDPWLTIVAISMIFIGYYFVSKIELNLHHIIRLKIYSTFFQLMCLVMYVEVPWPDAVKQFTQIFYALSFNIEITHPECAVSFNFFDKMKFVVIGPIAIGICMSLLSKYFNYQRGLNESLNDVSKARYYRRKWKTLRQIIVIFVTAVYSPVCYYALRMFEPCVTTELGEPVMSGDTRLKCNSAAYEFHSIFAWLALLSFGIGIPLGVVLLVKYLKRKRVLNKGEYLLRYGALYEWYNDEYAWFEAISLLRKGFMLLPVTLLNDVMLQAFLMMAITVVYALIIFVFKPFIKFPLRLKWVEREVDFYNFLEGLTAIATGFDLFLGVLAQLDKTREAASAIGVTFILVNTAIVVIAVGSFEAGLHKTRKKIKKASKNTKPNLVDLSPDASTQNLQYHDEEEGNMTGTEAIAEALSRPVKWSDVFNNNNDDDKEEVVEGVNPQARPGLRRGLSKLSSSKKQMSKQMSLRTMGGKQASLKNYGVRDIRREFDDVFNLADDECQELSERWFSEYTMMLEAKTEMHFGDAGAIKLQLQKTRARLADELSAHLENCLGRVREIEEVSRSKGLSEVANPEQVHAEKLVRRCRELHQYVLKFWNDSETNSVATKEGLAKLSKSHGEWHKDFHTRLAKVLEDETFETDSRSSLSETGATKNSALARRHYRKHGSDRRLSLTFSSSLHVISKENDDKKTELEEETQRLLLQCMDVDDFESAFMLEEHKIEAVEQYEHDLLTIQYGLEPSKRGKNDMLVKLRQMRAQVILPRIGVASFFFGALVLVTTVQSESTVEMAFYAGCIQLALGVFSVSLSRHFNRWYAVLLFCGCAVQVRFLFMSTQKCYDLATFRTFHTIPEEWRTSIAYKDAYYKWGEAAQAFMARTAPPSTQWWGNNYVNQLTPYDYKCSEVINIIVSNKTDACNADPITGDCQPSDEGGDDDFSKAPEDDDYVQEFGVSHIYGQCGGCASTSSHVEGGEMFNFDVALWEHSRGNNVSIHNCFYEMYIDRKAVPPGTSVSFGGGDDGTKYPFEYKLPPNNLNWGYPANYNDHFDVLDQFWVNNGHCRFSEEDGLYWDNGLYGEAARPLAFSNLYNLTDVKLENADEYWFKSGSLEETEGISRCTSCPDGFTFVVTGKQSIEKMPCKSADGPTWAARSKDSNLGADECKTTDPLLTLSTGVCVRAFNKKGRRAIQELRKEAKRAYASSFAEAPDVAAGHTDESRTDDDANPTQMDFYPDAIVSLERLETLWVASAYLLICCYILCIATMCLCLYSVRSSFYVQKFFSNKTFKTAEDASAVDWLKLTSIVLFATFVIINGAISIRKGSSNAQFSEIEGKTNIWCMRNDFVNTLNAKTGMDFLTSGAYLRTSDYDTQKSSGDYGASDQVWALNHDFFYSNTMFFMCEDGNSQYMPGDIDGFSAYNNSFNAFFCIFIPLFASFLHTGVLIAAKISNKVTIYVEEFMLRSGKLCFERVGVEDTRRWVYTRRLITILMTIPLPVLMGAAFQSSGDTEDRCNSYTIDNDTGKHVGDDCYTEYNNEVSFMAPFMSTLVFESIVLLLGFHVFRSFFVLYEMGIVCGMTIAGTTSFYLDFVRYLSGNIGSEGAYQSWEFFMFYCLQSLPIVLAWIVAGLKIKQFRLRIKTEPWLWVCFKRYFCFCCRGSNNNLEMTEIIPRAESKKNVL